MFYVFHKIDHRFLGILTNTKHSPDGGSGLCATLKMLVRQGCGNALTAALAGNGIAAAKLRKQHVQ